jgi:hypothetical protein
MCRGPIYLASFIVVLMLVGSVATGELVFLDDFEDGSATDGAPVTWSLVPGYNGSCEVIDGDYVLTRPSPIEETYCYVNQYMTLTDTSIRTQARLIPGGWWFGLGVRGNLGAGLCRALQRITRGSKYGDSALVPMLARCWPLQMSGSIRGRRMSSCGST